MLRRSRALVLAALLLPTVARADDGESDPRRVRARELFVEGARLARDARWVDALAAFEQSWLLRPNASTSYDLAYCERALGRMTRARKAFLRALAEAEGHPDELASAKRDDAIAFVAEAEARMARLRVEVAPAEATLTVDGRPLEREGGVFVAGTRDPGGGERVDATPAEVWVDPGDHVVAARGPDGRTAIAPVHVAPGARESITLRVGTGDATPASRPSPPLSPATTTPPPVAPEPDATRRIAAIALGGAGLVAAGVGSWLALRARSNVHDARDACPGRTACPDDRAADFSASARREANAATVAFVTAGAAFAGAGILAWVDATSRPGPASAGRTVSLTVRGEF